ncbi:hypothetical protein C2G38_2167436 [Gigaspora rosea]|uniref:Uncharacterized protein n=1 Tax=Gigaspora rosea TaxID=44941 RepID=A0A397VQQ0_9GLOM|nr:hypothetical protein C2G38_2167436 [Gigaspora rosea]
MANYWRVAGFVQGQALPNIGKWIQFSPENLTRLVERPIHKPAPIASEHSQPKKPWTIPVPDNNDNQIQLKESAVISDFPLKIGWALLSNQKLGKRGSGKRMSETVKKYLEAFFVAGDQNKSERMTGAKMVEELNKLVAEEEIDDEEVPQVKTINSWINRTSAARRKKIDEIQLNKEETDKSNSSAIPCNNRKRDKNINHEISEVESRNLGCKNTLISLLKHDELQLDESVIWDKATKASDMLKKEAERENRQSELEKKQIEQIE